MNQLEELVQNAILNDCLIGVIKIAEFEDTPLYIVKDHENISIATYCNLINEGGHERLRTENGSYYFDRSGRYQIDEIIGDDVCSLKIWCLGWIHKNNVTYNYVHEKEPFFGKKFLPITSHDDHRFITFIPYSRTVEEIELEI